MRSIVRKKNNTWRIITWIVVILILLVGSAAAYRLWRQYGIGTDFGQTIIRETDGVPQADDGLIGPDTAEVSRAAYNSWQVAEDQPRYFYIPSLSISAIVQSSDTNGNGEPAVPDNIHKVMWNSDSTKPGDKGVAVITGFISFDGQAGAFGQFDQLKSGDIIKIELGDGKALNFEIKSIETVAADELTADKLLTPAEGAAYGMNLLAVDDVSKDADRLIIYTALR